MSELLHSTNQSSYRFDARMGTAMQFQSKWKGAVYRQMVPTKQKNAQYLDISANNYVDNTLLKTGIRNNIFLAQPLKLYRKEIATVPTTHPTNPRSGMTLEALQMPGATIQIKAGKEAAAVTAFGGGLATIFLDKQEVETTNNSTDHPGRCASFTRNGLCMDPASNARRRVRRSGTLKQNYNSSTSQYLYNRNLTFQQNQYQYVQRGNTSTIPGTPAASSNVYRTQSSFTSLAIYPSSQASSSALSTCKNTNRPYTASYYKPNNAAFAQQGAVDAGSYILRRKFDTITNNVARYRKVYGNTVASAMGYGISDSVYTYKDKIGYPLKKTPVISKYTAMTQCCVKPTQLL